MERGGKGFQGGFPSGRGLRILVLCTHNSARSQMMEGWLRRHLAEAGLAAEVFSAGTEKTRLKPEAVAVMAEVGVDLSGQFSKTLLEVPDPWNFDLVLTVCDAAFEACPAYPARTHRLHVGFPDPTGRSLEEWRRVRDALGRASRALVAALAEGRWPDPGALAVLARLAEPQAVAKQAELVVQEAAQAEPEGQVDRGQKAHGQGEQVAEPGQTRSKSQRGKA